MFHWAVQRCLQEMCLVLAVKSGLLHKRRWMWLGIKILLIINKLNNWCFWTVCLRRLLSVPWTARRSNQSVLKEIIPEYLLEGQMLKLNLHWCEEPTHWKRPWCWERLKAGGERDDRGWHGWMASLTQWTWVWGSSRSWWWTGKPHVLQSMVSQRVGHN